MVLYPDISAASFSRCQALIFFHNVLEISPRFDQVPLRDGVSKASELRKRVCVLVSLLVGLCILSKLIRLVGSGRTGRSLVCLLVF